MYRSVMVIDDFYDNPLEVRQAALRLDYPVPAKPNNFPGRNSVQTVLMPNADQLFSQIIGEPVVGAKNYAHGRCRIALANDVGAYYVHIDPGIMWSGVLCLTLPEHCRSGTAFFRHRKYGTDGAPIRPEELAIYGAKSGAEVLDKTIEHGASKDMSQWEVTMTVPLRFNRLILFRSWMWHTAGESFGDSLANGRLVQLFFFAGAAAQVSR